jgi:hypothetical protein
MSEQDDYFAWQEKERKRHEEEHKLHEEERARIEGEGKAPEKQAGTPEQLAITVGAAIPAATTIDALFTALYATRSADLVTAGVPTYSWGRDNMIIAQWPALQTGAPPGANFSAMFCTFHARSDMARGSSIAQ